ncbi:hypothetical protein M406DRAFT_261659 [Cryphonectria parasitica EP155]|uniref:Serine hydrolase domain-containing protein n=1 Tax=Cryphonectria parasitica (strain ATCC 38755 / EP155) TaxID=660469 RepID=A0A9P4XYS6_CRYP1|nr:uncharacterized protein M406DRAFT_261659 [Cryphonectria parasitica EP155]KAF3763391.1 hypothetical protein M406DRAFT_261659 [Cryphonectria parasitica EP155]
MRFLCLNGAYGSADKFQVQLAPILKELGDVGDGRPSTFYFAHGPCRAVPPPGFEDYFGPAPHYRFIEPDGAASKGQSDDVLSRIREFPECEIAEDTMRELLRGCEDSSESDSDAGTPTAVATAHRSTNNAIRYILDIVKKHGPFDAVVGYSEGATMAATMLLYQQRQQKRWGTKPLFKYGIFFAGWPPLDPRTHDIILADESDERIETRTLHIVGSLDPYIHGSMALYNVCDMDTAVLFDHAKGHTLPRDKETIRELVDVICETVAEMQEDGNI